MTKEEIFEYFYTNSANLGIVNILLALLGGLLVGIIIYFTYYLNYKGVSYNRKFNVSLITLVEISVVIMLMISSNIVISLGMVGALSIVRFRTAIKDARDTVFIFFAIAEGLCVGSQNFQLAIVTTMFISIIMLALDSVAKLRNKYMIIIKGNNKVEYVDIINLLKKQSENLKVRSSKVNNDTHELIIEVTVKKEIKQEVIKKIGKISGIESVNYILESGEDIG